MSTLSRPSAGGIILSKEGKVVVVEQKGNSWSFPKGGIEMGEEPLEAAIREIREETGIVDVAFVQELGSYKRYSIGKDGVSEAMEWGLQTKTFFLFTADEQPLHPQDAEITEARWVSLDDAYKLLTHSKDKEFLKSIWHILK